MKKRTRGFSLAIALPIAALFAVALGALMASSLSAVKSGGAMVKRRQSFYACDGYARTIARLAAQYAAGVDTIDNAAMKAAIEAEAGGVGLPDIMLPGWQLEGNDFTISGTVGGTPAPLPSGPFRGMRARVDALNLAVRAVHNGSSLRCGSEQNLSVGQIFLFQFFGFSAGNWDFNGTPGTINGRVHTNGNFCLSAPASVETITAGGRLEHIDHCPHETFTNTGAGQIWDGSSWRSFTASDDHTGQGATWADHATARYNGNAQDEDHDVPILRVPLVSDPPMQPGRNADGNVVSNAQTLRYFVDPVFDGDAPDLREEKIAFKADIRIINGVWYRNDGTFPGAPMWSDHPGERATSNSGDRAVEYTITGAKDVGQEDIFGNVNPRPTKYSWYETDPGTHALTNNSEGVISYGAVIEDSSSRVVPAFWFDSYQSASPATRDPNSTFPRHRYCSFTSATAAASGSRGLRAVTDQDCFACLSTSGGNVDNDCSDGGDSAVDLDTSGNVLAAAGTGFMDARVQYNIGTTDEPSSRMLPINFDVAAFASALQDTNPGELGSHFTPDTFNGIIWISSTWPGQLDNFGSTTTLASSWPDNMSPQDADVLQAQHPVTTRTHTALPFPLCSDSQGYEAGTRRVGLSGPADDGSAANGFDPYFTIPNCDEAHSVTSKPNAVRIINGATLDPNVFRNGLSIATNMPVYVHKDFNQGSSVLANWVSVMIAGDAVTLMSNAWEDEEAYWGSGFEYSNRPDASDTYYQFALLQGKAPETASQWQGGIGNFPRLIERWSGQTLTLTGAMVDGFASVYAHQPYRFTSPYYYTGPTRAFTFDTQFENPANQPPGTPGFTVTATRSFTRF